MSSAQEYAKIPVSAVKPLVGDKLADFSVYLPGRDGNGPVLYRQAGGDASLPDLNRMRENGLAALFVKAEDLARCEGLLESKLLEVIERADISAEEKSELVYHVGTHVAQEIADQSSPPEQLDRAENVIGTIITGVLSDPAIALNLLRVSEHESCTASHMFSVSALAVILGARVLGQDEQRLRELGLAGMMHDLGKLSIDKAILTKREPLCGEEAYLVQQHPIESVRLLGNDPHVNTAVRQAILQHHERIDGTGYPLGISARELRIESRIITVVDSFHSLIGRRAYRTPMTADKANEILQHQAGRQFDPEVLRAWLQICEECDRSGAPKLMVVRGAVSTPGSSHSDHNAMRIRDRAIAERAMRHRCRGKITAKYHYVGRLGHTELDAAREFEAPVVDISRRGVGLFLSHAVYRGEVLNIALDANGTETWVRGAVAWCRPVEDNGYAVGIRFLKRIPAAIVDRAVEAVSSYAVNEDSLGCEDEVDAEVKANQESKGEAPMVGASDDALALVTRLANVKEIETRDAKAVIELASSDDAGIRRLVVEAIARINTAVGRQALLALLKDEDAGVREQAAGVVAARRMDDMLFALTPLLKDPVAATRLHAASALARNGEVEALQILIDTVKREGPEARRAASLLGQAIGRRFSANDEGVKAAKRYIESAKKAQLNKKRATASV